MIGVVVAEDTETAHAAAKLVKARQKQNWQKAQKYFKLKQANKEVHFANWSFTTDGLGELQRQGGAGAEHRGGFEEGGKGEQAQVGGGGW